jgi:hypothetical protein
MRGKAAFYDCVDCGQQAHDWSHKHGSDRDNLLNYDPRCCSCHIKYDYTYERRVQVALIQSSKLNEADVKAIILLLAQGYKQAVIARMFRVSRPLISDIYSYKKWGHVA